MSYAGLAPPAHAATTRHLTAVFELKHECLAFGCRVASWTGPSLGPNLLAKKFSGSNSYTLPDTYFSIAREGGPDTLRGRAHSHYFNFGESVGVTIEDGTGIFQDATGTGTIDCQLVVGARYLCLFEVDIEVR